MTSNRSQHKKQINAVLVISYDLENSQTTKRTITTIIIIILIAHHKKLQSM